MRERLIELIKEKIAIQAFDDGEYIDARKALCFLPTLS